MTLPYYTITRVKTRFTGVCDQCEHTVSGMSEKYVEDLIKKHCEKCKPVRIYSDPDLPWLEDYDLRAKGSFWLVTCHHCHEEVSHPSEAKLRNVAQIHVLRNHYGMVHRALNINPKSMRHLIKPLKSEQLTLPDEPPF